MVNHCHFFGCDKPIRKWDEPIKDPRARFCDAHALEIDTYLVGEDTERRLDFWVRAGGKQTLGVAPK